MTRMVRLAAAHCLILLLAGCTGGNAPATDLVVSAAASLGAALREAQGAFAQSHPDVRIRFNFGSSGALQQQVEQGAPADMLILAAGGPMARLVERGLVEPQDVHSLVSNRIVLVRSRGAEAVVQGWQDLGSERVGRIALGNPAHVPAGQYGQAVLEHLNLWAAVSRRLVLAEDARQVLNWVESGEVQAGIVYATDAAAAKKAVVVAAAPAGSHPAVVYPMAVLKGARQAAYARAFAEYLRSPQGLAVLTRHGFTAVP